MDVIEDFAAEVTALDQDLAGLEDEAWDLQTPAPTWAVRDQVGHLAFSEELATLALRRPDEFARQKEALLAAIEPADSAPRRRAATAPPQEILEWWRSGAAATIAALRRKAPKERVPWVVGTMSLASFATARLMETWAHGQDIADATGIQRVPTSRLRHVAHLGVSTRGFSHAVRNQAVPDVPVRVELTAPSGDIWDWGPPDATERVTGAALDFCLVVTQRRRAEDVDLSAVGPAAEAWLGVAQAFAGPPTSTRRKSATDAA